MGIHRILIYSTILNEPVKSYYQQLRFIEAFYANSLRGSYVFL